MTEQKERGFSRFKICTSEGAKTLEESDLSY